jgi:RNA polymerase sigma-70 factor (ECF subfamily)
MSGIDEDTKVSEDDLATLRRHAFGVAYRMLGSVSEAEDVAQETLLRLTRQEARIEEPSAWVTTVTTRLSINVLKSARVRRGGPQRGHVPALRHRGRPNPSR